MEKEKIKVITIRSTIDRRTVLRAYFCTNERAAIADYSAECLPGGGSNVAHKPRIGWCVDTPRGAYYARAEEAYWIDGIGVVI